ncbi:MAG: inositol monophosphatase family protein [Candidatus Odinarchaeia archaeon]
MNYLNLLLDISRYVYENVSKAVQNGADISRKIKVNISSQFTRMIDKMAEDIIMDSIEKFGAPVYVVSEEAGAKTIGGEDPKLFLIVDPIDGSANAISNLPFYSTSIALGKYDEKEKTGTLNKVFAGVVKNLVTGDEYYAVKGEGAFLNGKPISTSKNKEIVDSLISLYDYLPRGSTENWSKLREVAKIRVMGSEALEICTVAAGGLDACIDVRGCSRAVDTAAAKLILEEAGGIFADTNGNPLNCKVELTENISFVAAANKHILMKLLNFVGSRGKNEGKY